MTAPYSTSCTIDEIAGALRTVRTAAVVTHAKPDGDAVGSVLGLVRSLRLLEVQAVGVFPGPWFARFEPFVGDTPALRLPEGQGALALLREAVPSPDAVIVVDTGSWSQIGDVRAWIEPLHARTMILDHHPSGDAAVADRRVVRTEAAAAAEIIADLATVLLEEGSPRTLPVEVAEPLFLGVATDTGWFRYSNTRPSTLRLAADLLDAGVNQSRVLALAEQSDSTARLRIIARALDRMETLSEDRLAVLSLRQADFAATGATLDDAGRVYDLPQSVESVRVVAVLTEMSADQTKVSLRSKPAIPGHPRWDWFVDVNRIARTLGGGGHVHAAGARLSLPLEEARSRVVDEILGALP